MGSFNPSAEPDEPSRSGAVRLTLPASAAVATRWRCQSRQGQVLVVRRADHSPVPAFAAGSWIELSWQDEAERVVLELRAQVAECDASGLRLELPVMDRDLGARLDALIPAGGKVASGSGTPSPAMAQACIDAVAKAVRGPLSERCARMLARAELGLEGSTAAELLEVNGIPVRMALQRLRAVGQALQSEFQLQVLRPWISSGVDVERARRNSGLRLVDDDEMQVWLSRSESARGLERNTAEAWQMLAPLLRCCHPLKPELDIENLGVEGLLDALTGAFRTVGLEHGLQQFLLRMAAQPEVLDLNGFYALLQVELLRSGVQPLEVEARRSARPEYPLRRQAAERSESPDDRRAPSPAPFAPDADADVPASSAVTAAQRLLALGQSRNGQNDPARAEGPTLSNDDLLAAVRALAEQPDADVDAAQFRQRIESLAASRAPESGAGTDGRQDEALAMISRLQQAIGVDPLLPKRFRDWSRSLLAPILGTQLRPEGLQASGDALRRLLGLLEYGSVLCAERQDDHTREIRERIEALVGSLAGSPALDTARIDDASSELERLLQRHRKAGAAIEDRVVEACVGQQRLLDARQTVNQELALLFDGREVPEALAQLLEERLNALLVLAVLRHGAQSPEWRQVRHHLARMDHALRNAAAGEAAEDVAEVLAWIPQLVATQSADVADLHEQISELAHCLQGETVAWRTYASPPQDLPSGDEEPLPLQENEGLRQRMALLQPGDWLAFGAADTEPRLLKLAWHAPDRRRFVFVSQLGHKAEDLSGTQLLAGLHEERIRILDEGKASVVERAWRRMLEGLHDELAEQAIHDALTGLINRKELDRRLVGWINRRQRPTLALMWIGVDHLRVLNQSHGMGAGDYALRQVGEVLQQVCSARSGNETYAARIAGDEFALVASRCALDEARQIAEALLARFEHLDLYWDERRFRLSVSVGLSVADENCSSSESLLRDAERACRAAKDSGRGRIYLHQTDDFRLSQMRETVNWVGRVEQSLEEGSLVLFGQRALSLSERACKGPDYLEVLLRMRCEDSLASPEHFIVAAERYGQITAVDRFVLQELTALLNACTTAPPFRVAFNISAHNIVDPAFIAEMVRTLSEQPHALDTLCVELTETAAIQQLAEASAGMQRLSDAGLTMVLDDFGSGWSSYSYLRRLPLDIVKVDGAFIRDIATNPEDLALARSINEVAHMLGKLTVAEHIENQETLDLVREIGFDFAQGYFIERPRALEDFFAPHTGKVPEQA